MWVASRPVQKSVATTLPRPVRRSCLQLCLAVGKVPPRGCPASSTTTCEAPTVLQALSLAEKRPRASLTSGLLESSDPGPQPRGDHTRLLPKDPARPACPHPLLPLPLSVPRDMAAEVDIPVHTSGWQADRHQMSLVRQGQRAWSAQPSPGLYLLMSKVSPCVRRAGSSRITTQLRHWHSKQQETARPRGPVLGFRATCGPRVSTGHLPRLLGDTCRPVGAMLLAPPPALLLRSVLPVHSGRLLASSHTHHQTYPA